MALLLRCSALSFFLMFSMAFAATPFSKKTIHLGQRKIHVEVAVTPDQHARGLMFRESLPADEGMLFIFEGEEPRSFWMKNTLIDLSIAYFDKNGTLVDIQEMKTGKGVPDQILPSYSSRAPAKYALEMNKRWFDRNKIKLGTKLKINP